MSGFPRHFLSHPHVSLYHHLASIADFQGATFGNGYVAGTAGEGTQFVAGVFSGHASHSHRAALPALLPALLLAGDAVPYAAGQDLALNYLAVAYNLTTGDAAALRSVCATTELKQLAPHAVTPASSNYDAHTHADGDADSNVDGGADSNADSDADADVLPGTCVQRLYAHRGLPHVLVLDIRCDNTLGTTAANVTMVGLAQPSADVISTATAPPRPLPPGALPVACSLLTAVATEQPDSLRAAVGHCQPEASALRSAVLSVPAGKRAAWALLATQYANVDTDTDTAAPLYASSRSTTSMRSSTLFETAAKMGDPTDPAAAAAHAYAALLAQPATSTPAALFASHSQAMADLWDEGRIEVGGNATLARIVNASLGALLGAVRANVTFSTTPGGLATNGYHGHTFWDVETWMWPTWNMFFPAVARDVLQYRVERQTAAAANAAAKGLQGLMFPWESAYTGREVDPAPATLIEEHIEGDIAAALVQHWQATGDATWLRASFGALEGIAAFWAGKAVANANGTYSIADIMGPDEYHGPVNNSVYCNVVAQIALRAAYDLAPLAGATPNATFAAIAAGLVILFDPVRQLHPEFQGYTGDTVKQADVILLGYPLGYNMTAQVRGNDLVYYANRTDPNGPAVSARSRIGEAKLNKQRSRRQFDVSQKAHCQTLFARHCCSSHPLLVNDGHSISVPLHSNTCRRCFVSVANYGIIELGVRQHKLHDARNDIV